MKPKKPPAKAGNQMPVLPRRGSQEYRDAQREDFNKRFDAQKRSRQS